MTLSIIIVNYRAWGHLRTALERLSVDFPVEDWEVIVVDNESQAADLEKFVSDFPWVNFVANPANSGFAHGNNLGVAHAKGKYFLFMNPDVIAEVGALKTLMAEKERFSDVSILAPQQTDENGRKQKVFDDFPGLWNQSKTIKSFLRRINPSKYPDPRADYDTLTYCDWVSGSVLLISKADFSDLGGWSEDYWMYSEDADLCRRAHDRGLRVAFTPSSTVVHIHGGSSRRNIQTAAMTKLEVIISKHVYTWKHTNVPIRWLHHILIVLLKLPPATLSAALNLLTLGRLNVLRVRSKIFTGLVRYYTAVLFTGDWRSPRAIANQVVK